MFALSDFFARMAADKVAEIEGVERNDTNIIKLPWWYSLCTIISALFFGVCLLIPFFDPEAFEDQKSMIFLIILNALFWLLMILLFFHFLLYKIVIEEDHIRFRRLFFYRKYDYKNIYIYCSISYYFLYYGKRYLTRFSEPIDNIGTFFDYYRNYFKTTGITEPKGPQGYIKQCRMFLLLALIFQGMVFIMMGVFYVAAEEAFFYTFLLEIPVLLFLLYYFVWSIKFDKQEFTYRNFIGIKRRYPIKSLSYKETKSGYWIKKDGKRICHLWVILNSDELLKKITNEDKKVYKKKKK